MKTKLLLAVTLAATPALAHPTHVPPAKTAPKPIAKKPAPAPAPKPAPAPVVVAKPRTLPSGAPACGNVQTKSPRPRPACVQTAENK